jgi:hypothetical protein
MDFQNVPPPLVQPGHNKKFVSGGNSFETARREGIRFKPSVRRSFRTLLRRFFAILDRRSNDRNRTQLQPCASHRRFLPSASSFAPACHAHFLQASAKRSLFSFSISPLPERLSRSHVSCTAPSQCDQEILVHESRYQNSYLFREECSAFLDVLSPALGHPYVEQPYYVAFRLGDQEIGLDRQWMSFPFCTLPPLNIFRSFDHPCPRA